ncbi:MAG: ABC transporter permease, partial [Mesorhizobium sp.]
MSLQHIEQRVTIPAHGGRTSLGGDFPRLANRTVVRFLSRYGILIAFLAIWQVSSRAGWVNAAVLPPIDTIVTALWNGLAGGTLLGDIAISLQRAGFAFAAAVAVAIPLGLFMGQVRAVETALDPILQVFRQTSALALYPVFILLLGLGEASKIFVIFWATLFPLLLNTISGVKQVDPKLLEMARVYGATRLTVFRRVVLPAAVPSIFVGLRLSATTALLLLIASEMIGANKGIGFQVMNAQYNFQIPLM